MDFTFQLEDHIGALEQSSHVFGQQELPNQYTCTGSGRNLTPEAFPSKANHNYSMHSNGQFDKLNRSATTSSELCVCNPVASSDDAMSDRAGVYTCGGCGNFFRTVCELHKHLLDHGMGGSYRYNHDLRTAYLTFDSVCAGTQTCPLEEVKPYQHVEADDMTVLKLGDYSKGQVEAMSLGSIKLEPNDLMNKCRPEQSDSDSDTDVMDEDYIEDIAKQAYHEVKVEVDYSDNSDTGLTNVLKHTGAHKRKKKVKGKTKSQQKKSIGKSLRAPKKKISSKRGHKEISEPIEDEQDTIPMVATNVKTRERNKGRQQFPCDVCDKSYSRLDHLYRHQMKKHPEKELPPKKRKDIQCDYCDKTFGTKWSLYPHHRKWHPDKELKTSAVYYCHWCGKAFNKREQVKEHSKECDKDQSRRCFICDIKTDTLEQLPEHLATHRNDADLQCKLCRKMFADENLMHEHMKRHKVPKNIQCGKCGKKFRTPNQAHNHESQCGDVVKNYQCDQCQKGFKSRVGLRMHALVHSDKMPYICEVCGHSAKRKEAIAAHMRVHTKEQPHQCKTCGKRFSGYSNWRRHRLIHTDTKSFMCAFCGKAFITNWNRKAHELTHTGDTPYKCRHCGMGFRQNVARKQHIRKCHPFLAVDSFVANIE